MLFDFLSSYVFLICISVYLSVPRPAQNFKQAFYRRVIFQLLCGKAELHFELVLAWRDFTYPLKITAIKKMENQTASV